MSHCRILVDFTKFPSVGENPQKRGVDVTCNVRKRARGNAQASQNEEDNQALSRLFLAFLSHLAE